MMYADEDGPPSVKRGKIWPEGTAYPLTSKQPYPELDSPYLTHSTLQQLQNIRDGEPNEDFGRELCGQAQDQPQHCPEQDKGVVSQSGGRGEGYRGGNRGGYRGGYGDQRGGSRGGYGGAQRGDSRRGYDRGQGRGRGSPQRGGSQPPGGPRPPGPPRQPDDQPAAQAEETVSIEILAKTALPKGNDGLPDTRAPRMSPDEVIVLPVRQPPQAPGPSGSSGAWNMSSPSLLAGATTADITTLQERAGSQKSSGKKMVHKSKRKRREEPDKEQRESSVLLPMAELESTYKESGLVERFSLSQRVAEPATKERRHYLVVNMVRVQLPDRQVQQLHINMLRGNRESWWPSVYVPLNHKVVNYVSADERCRMLAYDGRHIAYTACNASRNTLANQEFKLRVRQGDDPGQAVVVQFVDYNAGRTNQVVPLTVVRNYYSTTGPGTFPQELLQQATIILNCGTRQLSRVGKWLFDFSQDRGQGQGGYQIQKIGFFFSIRTGQQHTLLNVDVTQKSFHHPGTPLVDVVANYLNIHLPLRRHLSSGEREELKKFLLNKPISFTHRNSRRTSRISGLDDRGPQDLRFEVREGETTTVAEYFRSRYPNAPRDLNNYLPCVAVKNSKFPMEVCKVGLGFDDKQLYPIEPESRFKHIRFAVRTLDTIARPPMQEFGMHIETRPLIRVSGLPLQPPAILSGNDRGNPIRVSEGGWRIDNKFRFYHNKLNNRKWAIMALGCRNVGDRDLADLATNLKQAMAGLQIAPLGDIPIVSYQDFRFDERNLIRAFEAVQTVPDVFLAILPRGDCYSMFKAVAETTLSRVTQCIQMGNLRKACGPTSGMMLQNILLKVNVKLGGSNWGLDPLCVPRYARERLVMYIGADVNHAAAGDRTTPSVAAVVASWDRNGSRYHAVTRAQSQGSKTNRMEYIRHLGEMFKDCLTEYKRRNEDKLPQLFYYYRDGVSDAEFERVRMHELTELVSACRAFGVHNPEISFIIVQKRHTVRFKKLQMADDREDGLPIRNDYDRGRDLNMDPGTLVDNGVVRKHGHDFYLCSHKAIRGTARPAHYNVVHLARGHNAREIERLSFGLCHIVASSTRTVSIPAPMHYAHQAAFRAKDYMRARAPAIKAVQSQDEDTIIAECQRAITSVVANREMHYI